MSESAISKTARAWANKALKAADEIAEPEAIAIAASLAGISHHLAGEHAIARRELESALRNSAGSDRTRTTLYGFDHRNRSSIGLARTLWLQGYADRAQEVAARTVREAARLDYPATRCIALVWALSVDMWTGNIEQAEADLDAFAHCAELNAFGPYIAAALGFRGKLAIHQGKANEALDWIEESLARLHSARYELLTTSFEMALTQGLSLSGRHREALEVVDATISRCEANGELVSMPELLRIKASVVPEIGGKADALLLQSIDWARRQDAKSWELRSTIDLARLCVADGRPGDAVDLLRPLRESFEEGFGTADLRTADQLLLSLAGGVSPEKSTSRETPCVPAASAAERPPAVSHSFS